MTPDEHRLMILMFTRQNMVIRSLMDILEKHGLYSDDDFRAYEALVRERENSDAQIATGVRDQYIDYSRKLGLPLSLETAEKSSKVGPQKPPKE